MPAEVKGAAHEAETEVIRDLLAAYPLSARVYPEVSYCGSWSLGTSGSRKCAFHVVVRGACWLHLEKRAATRLQTGELVLFPRDLSHLLSASPTPGATVSLAAEGAETSITCGYFEFADSRSHPILEALPDVAIVRPRDESERSRIAGLIALLADEARGAEERSAIVLDKLAEVLFATVLRAYLESSEEKRSFVAALTDTRLGRALAAVHRNADHRWHMDTLAELAGMSRTAFAETFSQLVGMPPMHYVAALRMRRAAALLKDPRNSVAAVAARMGYRSEAAFRRAFKRLEGSGPGALRRAAGAGSGTVS